jgi:hypothetical protein
VPPIASTCEPGTPSEEVGLRLSWRLRYRCVQKAGKGQSHCYNLYFLLHLITSGRASWLVHF